MKKVRLLTLKVKLLQERTMMTGKEEKLETIIRKKTSQSCYGGGNDDVPHDEGDADTSTTTNARRNSGGDAYATISATKNS